jgi:hypothetical protein
LPWTIPSALTAAVLVALAIEAIARLWIRRQDYFVHRRWDRARMCLDQGALPSMERVVNWESDRRVERVARELGVEQVDLMPVLEASLSSYYDFLHFTPAGSRQIAWHVAAAVRAPKLVPENMTSARVAMMVEARLVRASAPTASLYHHDI